MTQPVSNSHNLNSVTLLKHSQAPLLRLAAAIINRPKQFSGLVEAQVLRIWVIH